MKNALIIIDMLNDFIRGGVLANEEADQIVSPIKSLIDFARQQDNWVIVFANDAHLPEDREMGIWGEHAMQNTHGAQVISALKPQISDKEWEEPKRFYGAFEETPLAEKLRKHNVSSVYLTGQHTNCCVRHTAYGSFRNGLEIFVVKDAVVSFQEDNQVALQYLENIYGAKLLTTQEVLGSVYA